MSLILLDMGTNMNFKGFGTDLPVESRPPGNFSLVRQPSVYSLTFGEFQSSLGKDFGSMNMEELLKSIWSAEETQNVASAPAASTADGGNQGGYLQRQGSLTLPRTLSLKTVDEVWRDIAKDYANGKDSAAAASVPQTQRQPTLGEITLEEFLVRAGVVREDNQRLSQPNNNMSFGIDFQQPNHSGGLTGSRIAEKGAEISLQQRVFPLNVNGVGSTQHQPIATHILQQQHPKHQQEQEQQQSIFPRRSTVSCAPSVAIPSSNQLSSPEIRAGIVGLVTPKINGNLANGSALRGGGGGIGTVGFGVAGRGNGTNTPTFSSDGLKSSEDTSSVSPVPYMFNGGLRGRKSKNTVDKAIERRHRRMIKNRESAARSRARKQAYTMELEQEVAKLKEENEELRKKQAEIIEMQKNQVLEKMDAQYGTKKRRLMRTLTGPW